MLITSMFRNTTLVSEQFRSTVMRDDVLDMYGAIQRQIDQLTVFQMAAATASIVQPPAMSSTASPPPQPPWNPPLHYPTPYDPPYGHFSAPPTASHSPSPFWTTQAKASRHGYSTDLASPTSRARGRAVQWSDFATAASPAKAWSPTSRPSLSASSFTTPTAKSTIWNHLSPCSSASAATATTGFSALTTSNGATNLVGATEGGGHATHSWDPTLFPETAGWGSAARTTTLQPAALAVNPSARRSDPSQPIPTPIQQQPRATRSATSSPPSSSDDRQLFDEMPKWQKDGLSPFPVAPLTSSTSVYTQEVCNAFVDQYYQTLYTTPEEVFRFYHDSSRLSRPEPNGAMKSVTTLHGIYEKILSFHHESMSTEIKIADAQESHGGGIILNVTGYLTRYDYSTRNFAQSFFLAPQVGGYFILSDVFSYVDEHDLREATSVPANPSIAADPDTEDDLPNSEEIVEGPLDVSSTLIGTTTPLTVGENEGALVLEMTVAQKDIPQMSHVLMLKLFSKNVIRDAATVVSSAIAMAVSSAPAAALTTIAVPIDSIDAIVSAAAHASVDPSSPATALQNPTAPLPPSNQPFSSGFDLNPTPNFTAVPCDTTAEHHCRPQRPHQLRPKIGFFRMLRSPRCRPTLCRRLRRQNRRRRKDWVSWNIMVSRYVHAAHALFDKIPERDVVAWNNMLSAYAQSGHVNEARKILDAMPHMNSISWNGVPSAYIIRGQFEAACEFFESNLDWEKIFGSTIVPVASELLPTYLSAPEWQKHHAVLLTFAQIADGCSKVMIRKLEPMVRMELTSFQHSHHRVHWGAINAIGQLSTELGPDLQVKYHQTMLPALASAMDDFQHPRVQIHAASAVLYFSENCTPDILAPYWNGVVSKLLVLLQKGMEMDQDGALTALPSVLDSSQEHFQQYYDVIMPYLNTILMTATDKSKRRFHAKSMECISLVGMAVGKEKFSKDAKQVRVVLMSLQCSNLEADDSTTSYMLQAGASICNCLGQVFLPYLRIIMHPWFQFAQLQSDVAVPLIVMICLTGWSSELLLLPSGLSLNPSLEALIFSDRVKSSVLYGFKGGDPAGLLKCKNVELTAKFVYPYRNQSGFGMIRSGRDKIETPEQFQNAEETAVNWDLDGLVDIDRDATNTNACLVAENFRMQNLKYHAIGCPKPIDGNSMVLQSAEQTSSVLYAARLLHEARLPDGVLQVISGCGPTASPTLASHMDVDKLAITGSTDTAVKLSHVVVFFNKGECCYVGFRTFVVHERVYNELIEKTKVRALNRVVGDPFKTGAAQGPQIGKEQLDKILKYIKSGVDTGATLGRLEDKAAAERGGML